MNCSATTGLRQVAHRVAYSSSMCWRSGTSTRRDAASWAKALSSTAGSGAVIRAIAAIWASGLASAATPRIPAAMARRAVQPVPAHGSRTVSPGCAKAASAASSWLSAGGGWERAKSARPGTRRGRMTWSSPVRSASIILWLFCRLLFEFGLTGVFGKAGVELLDLLRVLVGLLDLFLVIVATSGPLHVRSDARCGLSLRRE